MNPFLRVLLLKILKSLKFFFSDSLNLQYLSSESSSHSISRQEKELSVDVYKDSALFSGNISLNKHAKQNSQTLHEASKKKNVVCNVCGKVFSEVYNLKVHFKIHTGEKNFVCDICNKAFVTKFNLINHYRIHTGEKPFVCNICNKAFNQKSALKSHYYRRHDNITF